MTSLRVSLALTLTLALGCGSSESSSPPVDSGVSDAPAADLGLPADGGGSGSTDVAAVTQSLVILHPNDLHSHLMGFGPEADYPPASANDDSTIGGLARLAARISAARTAAGTTPVLLLASGDYMMGTPFQV